jgi:multicomponent Na+:H+ antiporter subunit D
MVVGVLLAVGQWDFKRLLAYHSISQMGYVVLALGVGAEQMLAGHQAVATLAIFGGLFHLINHATFKSLLFLCSGSVVYATGERDMHVVGGIREKMPITSLCTRIGALSISGIPPFNGFFSKLIIILSVVWAGHWLLGGLTVLVSFVTLLSFTKVQRYLVEGELPARFSSIKESPAPMLIALGILSVFCLALGLLALEALGPAYHIRLPVAIIGPARDALQAGLDYARSVLGGGG